VLLINGVIALIGILIAALVIHLKLWLGLHGFLFFFTAFLGLWLYLFLSDLAEDWLINRFNPSGS
jgi:hypothetical protein